MDNAERSQSSPPTNHTDRSGPTERSESRGPSEGGARFAAARTARPGELRESGADLRSAEQQGDAESEFPGFSEITYHEYTREGVAATQGPVISESFVCLYLNGAELATLMASPSDAVELVIGFLRSEGLIESPDDPEEIVPAPNRRCVDVWLKDKSVRAPGRRIVTSGCGGGVTFEDVRNRREPITTDMRIEADALIALMAEFTRPVEPRGKTRGLHAAALSDGSTIMLKREDIGRHNAIDRLWGAAMLEHVETAGRFLMSTGRISSEMLMKAARMRTPIVASRTTPTSLTVRLAREWNITLVGYVRSHLLRVYSHPERIVGAISE